MNGVTGAARHNSDKYWHGTRTAYYNGCRCDRCRAAEALYQRERRRRIRRSVPAAETQRHVVRLLEAGLSKAAIAALASVTVSTVTRIAAGKWQRLSVEVADSILGIAFDDLAPDCRVPSSRVRPMLDEMERAGFNKTELARITKRKARFQVGNYDSVYPRNYRVVVTLYKLLARAGRVPAELLEELP